jgi:hypothetical protein
LVPALRRWLTSKQKETRRGRAELRLAERAALWKVRPEKRQLPSLWEWANIRLFTRRRNWTGSERLMMRAAGRHHGFHTGVRLVLLALALLVLPEIYSYVSAYQGLEELKGTRHADVPKLVAQLKPHRRYAEPFLVGMIEKDPWVPEKRSSAYQVLVGLNPQRVHYLCARLLKPVSPDDTGAVLAALSGHWHAVKEHLWTVLEDVEADPTQRSQALKAVLLYDRDDGRWPRLGRDVGALFARTYHPAEGADWHLLFLRGNSLGARTLVDALRELFVIADVTELERYQVIHILLTFYVDRSELFPYRPSSYPLKDAPRPRVRLPE